MKKEIIKVETIEELAIRLPEDFAEVGEKVHVSVRDDGTIVISKLVPIELDLPNDVLLGLTMMAHEQDITLNELCCNILRKIVETDGECLVESDRNCHTWVNRGTNVFPYKCSLCGALSGTSQSRYKCKRNKSSDKTTEGN
jgi:hypothetical protein